MFRFVVVFGFVFVGLSPGGGGGWGEGLKLLWGAKSLVYCGVGFGFVPLAQELHQKVEL